MPPIWLRKRLLHHTEYQKLLSASATAEEQTQTQTVWCVVKIQNQ